MHLYLHDENTNVNYLHPFMLTTFIGISSHINNTKTNKKRPQHIIATFFFSLEQVITKSKTRNWTHVVVDKKQAALRTHYFQDSVNHYTVKDFEC